MPTVRHRVSYVPGLFCFAATICTGPGFASQQQTPQTQQQVEARDVLKQGVQAFKNGQSDEATRLFLRAKDLDPNFLNARLYLATAYASLFIPGAPSEENRRLGQRAIDEFKGVLHLDAQNLSAMDGIGSLLFQMAGTPPVNPDLFKESKSFHEKHIQIKSEDPEPYYWVGVIDWTLAFRANNELRAKYNASLVSEKLDDSDPLPPYLQVAYADAWESTIDEGIKSMQKAIELRPEYDDAMAYLNLLYRRKADAVVPEFEKEQFTKMADDLIDKVKGIKQRRMTAPAEQPN